MYTIDVFPTPLVYFSLTFLQHACSQVEHLGTLKNAFMQLEVGLGCLLDRGACVSGQVQGARVVQV